MRNKSVFGIATLIFSLPALVGAGPLAPTPAAAVENCAALALVNGSFEAPLPSPPANIGYWWGDFLDASQTQDQDGYKAVPGIGWLTTQANHLIEFWNGEPTAPTNDGPHAFDGDAFVELNAWEPGALYQDISTVPGTSIAWSLAHRGRSGVDTMAVEVGAPGQTLIQQGPDLSDGTAAWGVHTGVYQVPASQTVTRFSFRAVDSVGGGSYGNFLDGISFAPYNCLSETPSYDPPAVLPTSDGFTFQLTNSDLSGMTAATDVGSVAISANGVVTVSGVPSSSQAVVVVTNSHPGFVSSSATVTATSLGSALIPKFDTPTLIDDGFTAQITNYDPDFNWEVRTSDSSSASVDRTGLVTVTNNPSETTVVPVITSRPSYLTGSSFVKISSVRLPTVVYSTPITPDTSANTVVEEPVKAVPITEAPIVKLKPITTAISGFEKGSWTLTAAMRSRLKVLITKYSDYKFVSVTGFTGGPTILKQDYAISRNRAKSAGKYIESVSGNKIQIKKLSGVQKKQTGSHLRKIVIVFSD